MTKLYFAAKSRLDAVKDFLLGKQEGASMVEYGLLVALIAIACVLALTNMGTAISGMFQGIADKIPTVP